jgi:hypothetical protein
MSGDDRLRCLQLYQNFINDGDSLRGGGFLKISISAFQLRHFLDEEAFGRWVSW